MMPNKPKKQTLIGELYKQYGGWRAIISSKYLWVSLIISALCWRVVLPPSIVWTDWPKAVSPALAGFSMASFALLFSIFSEKARVVLAQPAPDLGGKSPLLVMASSLFHAFIVQVLSIIYALIYLAKPFPYISYFGELNGYMNIAFSYVGVSIFFYGLVLVIASSLSIFSMLGSATKL